MAQRIEIKTVTVPALTTKTSPQSTPLGWREGYPVWVELRIPPGPSGLVGIALAHSGRKIIPKDESEWLISDSEVVSWALEDYPYNPNWRLLAYNDDIYDHAVQVRMGLREIGTPAPQSQSTVEIVVPNASVDVDQVPNLADYVDVGASP